MDGLRDDRLAEEVSKKLLESGVKSDEWDIEVTNKGVNVSKAGEKTLNQFGFYYNQAYLTHLKFDTYISVVGMYYQQNIDSDVCFYIDKSGNAKYKDSSTVGEAKISSDAGVYTIEFGGYVFVGEFIENGTKFNATCKHTSNSGQVTNLTDIVFEMSDVLATDGEYIYSYIESSNTYNAFPIDATKTKYAMIKSNINGIAVTAIAPNAFKGNANLKEFIIPEGITTIGANAFEGCVAIESLKLPKTLTQIVGQAFNNPEHAELDVYFAGDIKDWCAITFGLNANPILGNSKLYIADQLMKNIVISSDVEKINDRAFYNYLALESIQLPDNITIGTSAFANTTIGNVIIPAGAKIGDSAFVNANIEEVFIPSGTTIGNNAFSNCSKLKNVQLPTEGTTIAIGNNAFSNCTSLESINIDKGVYRIGNNAFYNCSKLKNVVIGENVTYIGSMVFFGTALTTLEIKDLTTWYRASSESSALMNLGLTATDLSDMSSAITYFTNTYKESVWVKK